MTEITISTPMAASVDQNAVELQDCVVCTNNLNNSHRIFMNCLINNLLYDTNLIFNPTQSAGNVLSPRHVVPLANLKDSISGYLEMS